MTSFHFIRPYWLFLCLPLAILLWQGWVYQPSLKTWEAICDPHLLKSLLKRKPQTKRLLAFSMLGLSALTMIIALAGPSWTRLAVPVYQAIKPKVLLLDLSTSMLERDLTPNRLSRAKFKLHDLFKQSQLGQVALIVYSGEPFVVSPLTDDAQTIDALLPALHPDLMPVEGQRLDNALKEAQKLIEQAGFKQGQILVLTAKPPTGAERNLARNLAQKQIYSSIMPMRLKEDLAGAFSQFAAAGGGQVLTFVDRASALNDWIKAADSSHYNLNKNSEVFVWEDKGRWFLLPALLLLLPIFRRGWIQRIAL